MNDDQVQGQTDQGSNVESLANDLENLKRQVIADQNQVPQPSQSIADPSWQNEEKISRRPGLIVIGFILLLLSLFILAAYFLKGAISKKSNPTVKSTPRITIPVEPTLSPETTPTAGDMGGFSSPGALPKTGFFEGETEENTNKLEFTLPTPTP